MSLWYSGFLFSPIAIYYPLLFLFYFYFNYLFQTNLNNSPAHKARVSYDHDVESTWQLLWHECAALLSVGGGGVWRVLRARLRHQVRVAEALIQCGRGRIYIYIYLFVFTTCSVSVDQLVHIAFAPFFLFPLVISFSQGFCHYLIIMHISTHSLLGKRVRWIEPVRSWAISSLNRRLVFMHSHSCLWS